MSFALTTQQVLARTKTVTRRVGWAWLKPGTLLQPVAKCQGIPKGGHVEKIGGPIKVVSARRLPVISVDKVDCIKEGFPDLTAHEFVEFFCRHNGCAPATVVTRIEFEYVEATT